MRNPILGQKKIEHLQSFASGKSNGNKNFDAQTQKNVMNGGPAVVACIVVTTTKATAPASASFRWEIVE